MKRDQTVYTCDGCRNTKAYDFQATPPGWYRVTTAQVSEGTGSSREQYLCLRCFAGIDWIIRFQGITVPPAVVSDPVQIRGQADQSTGRLHVTVDVHDGPHGSQHPGATHVHNHGPDKGPGTSCRERRAEDGRLVGDCITTEIANIPATEEPFSPVRWAESLLAARFPGQPLQLTREPHLDVDVRHNALADEYFLTLELRAVRVLTTRDDDAEEPTA